MFKQLYMVPSTTLSPQLFYPCFLLVPSPARFRISSSSVPYKEMKQLLDGARMYCIFRPERIFQNFLLQMLKSVHAKI